MANTQFRNYPLPEDDATVREEFERLQQITLQMVDNDVNALFAALAGKASINHGHTIAQITGLQAALGDKMDKTASFTLEQLSDVAGTDVAPAGYVLIKTAEGWTALSPAAALGDHGHTIEQITGLTAALAAKLDTNKIIISTAAASGAAPEGALWFQIT